MLNEINCWQCEKRKGEEKTPNPYKIRIMLAASCSTLKGLQTTNSKMPTTKLCPH